MFLFAQENQPSDDLSTNRVAKPVTFKKPKNPAVTSYDYYKQMDVANLISPKLYKQEPPNTDNISSQKFEAAQSAYDSNAADDFTVPANTYWKIESVFASGTITTNAHPTSFNVTFYTNTASNLPGTVVRTENVVLTAGSTSPTLPLATPLILGAGKYWISVQAVMDWSTGGQWYWNTYNDSATLSAPFAWYNPGNGFATSCNTNWNTASVCLPTQLRDLQFSLNGSVVTPCKSFTGRLTTADPTHVGRMNRFQPVSVCGTVKPFPGYFATTGNFQYKTYSVTNATANSQCITFNIINADANFVHLTAYNTTFNPADLSQNYMGDVATSSGNSVSQSMGITVPANATVIIVASAPGVGLTYTADYTIEVIAPDCGVLLRAIENEKNTSILFPNPTKGKLFVNGVNLNKVSVFDTSGKLVPVKNTNNEINVENLTKGNYLIQYEDKNGKVYTDKFIKN